MKSSAEVIKFVKKPVPSAEQWVDLQTVAAHIGFCYQKTRSMFLAGEFPGRKIINGARTFYRFRLSDVDQAMLRQSRTGTE